MRSKSKITFSLSLAFPFVLGLFFYASVFAADINLTASVSLPICGNEILESGEVCDGPAAACSAGYNCLNCLCIPATSGCTPGSTVCSWGACVSSVQTGVCDNGCSTWSATQACTLPVCGNNTIEAGEECDDGNNISNDGCSAICQIEVGCGNGSIEAGEECDDGNLASGDCCSAACEIELIISAVTETSTKNSAVITWQTQCQNTNSVVDWGKTSAVSDGSAGGLSGTNYSYNISGLIPDTVYFYRITATAGTLSSIKTGTFNTSPEIEICDNNLDDDGDGLIDQVDPDCPCSASYSCEDWTPFLCPSSGIQNRVCTKTNSCWSNLPLPTVTRSCSPSCELTCSLGQYLDIANCQCLNIVPFCGNGICEAPGENPGNCPADCGGCMSDWECSTWEPEICPENNIQTRSCFDKNACSIPVNPPSTQQSCGGVCQGLNCGLCQQINTQSCLCEELVPCCGNSVCEQGESNENCSDDCIQLCTPSWNCSAWGSCANGVRYRECFDANNCNINLNRPPNVISCEANCSLACGTCQQIDIANCRCLDTIPCCGNRSCEVAETTWSCGVDCGLPPSVTLDIPDCMDGIDNDNDGQIDYPADTSCAKSSDKSETSLMETIQELAADLGKSYQEFILDNPQVQTINQQFAAPILVATVAVNAVSGISFLNFFSYLRYLFSQPLALIGRRRRTKWGTVYNALTKQPIDLAIVRIYRKSDNRLVQSRVTDKLGRFTIMAEPGDYYVSVTKPQYVFPTQYLKDKVEDVKYLDLYHGETIKVTESRANITVNIPLDPTEDARPVRKIILLHYLRKVQYAAAFLAVPLATISLILSPGWLTVSLLLFHILLYVLFRRLGYQKPPKSWGIIYDSENKTPLARAITRIYDKKYNKLLETRITDSKGRYTFLVNNNIYYVTTEKPGYNTYKSEDIDLISKEREAIVDLDIGLKKQAAKTIPQDLLTPEIQENITEKNESISEIPTESVLEKKNVPDEEMLPNVGVGRQTLDVLLNEKVQQRIKEEEAAKSNSNTENKSGNSPEKSIFG